jgi:thermitase
MDKNYYLKILFLLLSFLILIIFKYEPHSINKTNKSIIKSRCEKQSVNKKIETSQMKNRWGFDSMNFPLTINVVDSREVKVAILDSGIDNSHEEINSHISQSYNAFYPDEKPIDRYGHGTHVAGIITLSSPNFIKIIPIKVLDDNGYGTLDSITKGLDYAIQENVDIISMNLKIEKDFKLIKTLIKKAYENNIIIVAPSGNAGVENISYPAAYKEVIAVGAYDINEKLVDFSQFGNNIDFVAPGKDIYSTYLNGRYKKIDGTSQASAFLTRAVAYYLSQVSQQKKSPENVLEELRNATIDMGAYGYDKYTGYGKIDIRRLLDNNQQ